MAVATRKLTTTEAEIRQARMPFWQQVTMLTWRNLKIVVRTPEGIIPSIAISVFFLLIYDGSFSEAATFIPGLGSNYLAFILPFSLVSSALSGSSVVGLSLVRDIESGYFDKLLLTPVSRAALLLGPILAGGVALAFQTVLVIVLALIIGMDVATGVPGLLAVLGLSMLVGIGFGGFTVGVALRTGSAAATSGASFLFFPLSFLTAANVPLELLTGWIKTAATLNPITYILEAMREILRFGWDGDIIAKGLIACAVLFFIPYLFALTGLRARTRRK
ncbi:MAG: ABC transporter permease [bacterium]|nr:ABC transporter permease [bacterium]